MVNAYSQLKRARPLKNLFVADVFISGVIGGKVIALRQDL